MERPPQVSLIVVVYNIPREASRTLRSLSADYQIGLAARDYEVIVVDNGSNPPLDFEAIPGLSDNFRFLRIDDALPSPAQALNRGLLEARGETIGIMIDGARLATPGLLNFARRGAELYERAVVASLGWYLGPDFQWQAIENGYDRAREDALLKSIDWPNDGYRLFEIGTMDESSVDGWFQPIAESNALFLRRTFWDELGGLDERFDGPGGGLLNLDTFNRAIEYPNAQLVVLLGEATFHQVHGGTNTNAPPAQQHDNWISWGSQYANIRGRPYRMSRPRNAPTYIGTLPRPVLIRFARSVTDPFPRLDPTSGYSSALEPPLGFNFDKRLWSLSSPTASSDPTATKLTALMHAEFVAGRYAAAAAVARLIGGRASDEPEPQRMLSLLASYSEQSSDWAYRLALAKAHEMLGENETAISHYHAALSFNPNLAEAHIGLAKLRMPGDSYHVWLERFYTTLEPENVVEIGVYLGQSLSYVCPPTVAIGVDPHPSISFPMKTETHLFAETSDEFFKRNRLKALLADRPLGIGFIDGLHLYEQALSDFIHLEKYCGPHSVILFHDTIPLDEATQSRRCDTQFHTGDVWKTVLCLKHYRPDLDIFTIATGWTGLTVVTGLDPGSALLEERYEEAVARFIETPYREIENNWEIVLNVVPNKWDNVEERLKARGIL